MESKVKHTIITLGDWITHKTFGKGKIVGVKKEGTLMITVQFNHNGRKKDFIYPHPAIQVGEQEIEKSQSKSVSAPLNSQNNMCAADKKMLRTVYVDKNYEFLNKFSSYIKVSSPFVYNNESGVVLIKGE